MLKSVLLFVAGILVGANAVYYLMTRGQAPAVRTPSAAAETTPAGAAPPALPARAGGVVAAPASESASPPRPASTGRPGTIATPAAAPANALLMPVSGVRPEQIGDTFNDLRGGSRIHEALDIMAPRGTPVVAAVDGKVEKLFTSAAGGLTVYQFDPAATHAYYYAHLDRYAPGLAEGQALKRGDPIGYVGFTGNASADAPHLHFAIFLLGPEKKWWEGTPVNPYPLLAPAR